MKPVERKVSSHNEDNVVSDVEEAVSEETLEIFDDYLHKFRDTMFFLRIMISAEVRYDVRGDYLPDNKWRHGP